MSRNGAVSAPNPGNHTSFKHVSGETEFSKSREFMGPDLFPDQAQLQTSGLARYRSAPSSFLGALLDSTTDNSSSGDESEAFFSALMDGPRDLKQEGGAQSEARPGQNGPGPMGYSVGMENQVNPRMNNGDRNSSNLVRQSSSPAGFFNGYGVMREVGNYGVHNNHSKPNYMPSIPESIGPQNHENGQLANGNSSNGREFEPVFPQDSWNDPAFNSLKRNRDGDVKTFSNFNGFENQNGETRKSSPGLVHHLSLLKTSSEIENFLQFQTDTVPCQIRAKRGCATHPRSIAERMRRTRISEKMKKLQDLFPNMDKQTSTADMLDLAVEYIKDLQKQVQTLTETKTMCVCPSKPQQTSPTT